MIDGQRTSCEGLRLLLVATYPPPFGGIGTHLTTLIPGLNARGAEDIAVVSFRGGEGVERREGMTLYRYELPRALRRLLHPRNWRVAWYTLRTLGGQRLRLKTLVVEATKAALVNDVARRHRSRVVSFYASEGSLEMPALARAWRGRRGLVLTVFGEVYSDAELVHGHTALFQELLRIPARVAASSCHCAGSFRTIGVKRPIDVVHYGVTLDGFTSPELRREFRERHGIADGECALLFMGRLARDMGLDVLLKAAPGLLARNAALRLVIAGGRGELTDAARALAAREPARVLVMEDLPFEQQRQAYSGADMLVAPSFNQRACMGMSIKEAMAASLPVIGGAGGGMKEAIVDGETGYLVPLDSQGSVDGALFTERVLEIAGDPGLARRLGEAGRRRAEEMFSFDLTNERMAEIFMSANPA